MKVIRRNFPAMRRNHPTAIIHSGGRQTIFNCICGSRHTTSTDWNGREAKHVIDWQREHADCAIQKAEKLLKGETVDIYFGK